MKLEHTSNAASLNMIVNENDIEVLDEYIDNHNTWTNSYNCSSFASEAWNLVSDIYLDPYNDILFVDTPKKLSNSIKDVSGYFTGIQFTVVSNIDDYVGYYGYDSNDNGVFIEQLQN